MRPFAIVEGMLVAGLAVALIVKPQPKSLKAEQQPPVPMMKTSIGESKKLGDGVVRSFVRTVEGRPVAVGVTFTEAALNNLPTTGDRGLGCCQNETLLHLPQALEVPPFTHIAVNWNPNGHVPPGIYDKPHFDFHFYMMDDAERQKIAADDANFAKPPPAECVPAGHIATPGVMKMGVHWIDPASPEFHGVPFTKTFMYGAYNGRVNFVEPMITKAQFETKQDSTDTIAQPKVYPLGYFPTAYSVKYDAAAKEYTVVLEGLTAH